MTGDPIFTGPVRESRTSVFCPSRSYTDFHFTCRVQYPQQVSDDGARFRVSLTFDGKTVNKSDTHVLTNATATTVIFHSLALRGNVGKTVNALFSHCTFCDPIKETKRRVSCVVHFPRTPMQKFYSMFMHWWNSTANGQSYSLDCQDKIQSERKMTAMKKITGCANKKTPIQNLTTQFNYCVHICWPVFIPVSKYWVVTQSADGIGN